MSGGTILVSRVTPHAVTTGFKRKTGMPTKGTLPATQAKLAPGQTPHPPHRFFLEYLWIMREVGKLTSD